MKCPNCGGELEAGQIYCEKCGHEIQIVPDYDPLDEWKVGQEETQENEPVSLTEKERKKERKAPVSPETGKLSGSGRRKYFLAAGCTLLCIAVFCLSYFMVRRSDSYSYQLRHGKTLVAKEEYEKAVPYLIRAEKLQENSQEKDPEPMQYLASAYAHMGEKKLAVECISTAVAAEEELRGDSEMLLELYLAYMEVLNLTGQTSKVETVIEECRYEDIQKALLPYRIEKPSCDVPEGTYGYYLRLELEARYGSIYYTLDGTSPSADSTLYSGPIELQEEGEILLSAVAVNEKGMISEPLVRVYKINFQSNYDEMEV